MALNQEPETGRSGRAGSCGPGFGGMPDPVDLSAYPAPDGGAGVLAGGGASSGAAPGAGHEALAVVRDAEDSVRVLGDAAAQLIESELDEAARALLAVREQVERSLVLLLADALDRGVVASSDSGSARQWLADRAGHLEPGASSRITVAAEEMNRRENAAVRQALVAGEVSVDAVVTALREAPKAMVVLPAASRDEVLGYYLAVAQAGGTAKDLRRLTRQVVAEYGGDRAERDEQKAQDAESLTWHELPSGLVELIAILSPGHGAHIIEAITALSAPQPTEDPDTGGKTPDPRPATKRRCDALVEIVGLAARVSDKDAMRSTAKLILTMGFGDLTGTQVDPTGGFGVTATGKVVDAGTARRMACGGDIIPAVLGTDSAPLDVGRAERLFTGGLRTAIILRDKQCTFPGCERPPGWCEAHHIVPWWAGGETSLQNGTLLCSRHHHVVHSRGYLADVTGQGVQWDLTPDRMPHHAGAPPGEDAAA